MATLDLVEAWSKLAWAGIDVGGLHGDNDDLHSPTRSRCVNIGGQGVQSQDLMPFTLGM